MAIVWTTFFMSVLLCTSSQYIHFNEKYDCNSCEKITEEFQTLLTQQRRIQREVDQLRQDIMEIRDLLTNLLSTSCIYPFDCFDIYNCGRKRTGVYEIYPVSTISPIQVLCDMGLTGGGWTVIQHRNRENPHVNFNTTWNEYKRGFGNIPGNYWLGNDAIHKLTAKYNNSLYIRFESTKNESFEVEYSSFSISDEADGYRLSLGSFSGIIDDAFRSYRVVGSPFSTVDNDNRHRCAARHGSGWWYDHCTRVNLNAPFLERHVQYVWYTAIVHGSDLFLSEMLIRRK